MGKLISIEEFVSNIYNRITAIFYTVYVQYSLFVRKLNLTSAASITVSTCVSDSILLLLGFHYLFAAAGGQ